MAIKCKDANHIRVLVGHNKPAARTVKLEMTRGAATCVEKVGLREKARLVIDSERRNAVVAAVTDEDKVAGRVDADSAARVHTGREGWVLVWCVVRDREKKREGVKCEDKS